MADKALAALKSLWSKLPIKAPWKVCHAVFTHTMEPCPVCARPLLAKAVPLAVPLCCSALADALVQRAFSPLCAR